MAFNRANYVEAAIQEVYKTLLTAFILVVIIIYLFLGNLKAIIVPAIALPVSLIASFLGFIHFWLINKHICTFKFYFGYWNNY